MNITVETLTINDKTLQHVRCFFNKYFPDSTPLTLVACDSGVARSQRMVDMLYTNLGLVRLSPLNFFEDSVCGFGIGQIEFKKRVITDMKFELIVNCFDESSRPIEGRPRIYPTICMIPYRLNIVGEPRSFTTLRNQSTRYYFDKLEN